MLVNITYMDPICFMEKVAKRHFINFLNSSHDLELQAELFYGWAAWGWALHFLQEMTSGDVPNGTAGRVDELRD